jgi:hypothetical protein
MAKYCVRISRVFHTEKVVEVPDCPREDDEKNFVKQMFKYSNVNAPWPAFDEYTKGADNPQVDSIARVCDFCEKTWCGESPHKGAWCVGRRKHEAAKLRKEAEALEQNMEV